MNQKLLIIDGSSLLSTSFYGTAMAYTMAKTEEDKMQALSKLLQTSNGQFTNGVYTFTKTLLSLIKQQAPTHMAIVWDVTRASFRKTTISGEYKGTRKETPMPLKEQFKTTQDLFAGIIPQYMSQMTDDVIYEADDFAGSLAKKFETCMPTYLYTKDEDYLQLVSPYTRVWLVTSKAAQMFEEVGVEPKEYLLPNGVFEYTLTSLKDLKGLEPYQIVEYKALCGDSSDNIPGVKGIGPKAVVPLLNEYGDIQTIYEMIEDLDEKEQKAYGKFFKEALGISRNPIKNLIENKASAWMSQELATIKTDIPEIQELTLEDVALSLDIEALKTRLMALEMKSLVDELSGESTKASSKQSVQKTKRVQAKQSIEEIQSIEEVKRVGQAQRVQDAQQDMTQLSFF